MKKNQKFLKISQIFPDLKKKMGLREFLWYHNAVWNKLDDKELNSRLSASLQDNIAQGERIDKQLVTDTVFGMRIK